MRMFFRFFPSVLHWLLLNSVVLMCVFLAMNPLEDMAVISGTSFIAFVLSFRRQTPWQSVRNDGSMISPMYWRVLDWLRRSQKTAFNGSKSTVHLFFNIIAKMERLPFCYLTSTCSACAVICVTDTCMTECLSLLWQRRWSAKSYQTSWKFAWHILI